jgi:cellulose biosynthesis protein BcsQ
MRSVLNAATLWRWLQREQPSTRFFFLLNQFDPTNNFHRKMRDRLAAGVGSMLLGMTVSKSDEASEALSAGKTVLELAPNAAVCEDFNRLAWWLCGLYQNRGQARVSASGS